MAMPPCGTFHYAGTVPDLGPSSESAEWRLDDQSGVESRTQIAPSTSWKFWKRGSTYAAAADRLRDNRLIGHRPAVRISRRQLVLEAASPYRAEVRSASLECDSSLLESLHEGDFITLVRTPSADIGVSLLRGDKLFWAIGAVTAVPLGHSLRVHGGPRIDFSTPLARQWPRTDTWIDVFCSGHSSKLHDGEDVTAGEYRVSVLRTFKDGCPGKCETVAIAVADTGVYEAAVRSARLLERDNAGLTLTRWGRAV
jgi:hypothetical protein